MANNEDIIKEENKEPELENKIEAPAEKKQKLVAIEAVNIKEIPADSDSYDNVINTERLKIFKGNKTTKIISYSSIALVLLFAIPALFLISVNKYLSIGFLAASGVVLVASSIVVRIIAKPDMPGYTFIACREMDRKTYSDGRFTNVIYDPKHKVEISEVSENGAYKNLVSCISRNYVTGEFDKASFISCELATYKQDNKKIKSTAFIGKFYQTSNDLHFENRFVLVKKSGTSIDPIDAVEDLKVLVEEENFTIYGPEGADAKKALSAKFIDAVKDFVINETLLQVVVSVFAGKTLFFLSYSDEAISIPLSKPLNLDVMELTTNNLVKTAEASALLNKGKK